MAGAQGSALAMAVSNAGGLGSLPCALLTPMAMRDELRAIRAGTERPFNANFFCHAPPLASRDQEAKWRAALDPYVHELGINPDSISLGPALPPFDASALEVLAEFKPAVVSFHFGLPSGELLERIRGLGAKILCSATTVEEASNCGKPASGR